MNKYPKNTIIRNLSTIFVVFVISVVLSGCTFIFPWQKNTSDEVMIAFEEGQRFLKKYEYSSAIRSFVKVTQLDPNYQEAYFAISDIYLLKGRGDLAIDVLRDASEIKSARGETYARLAMVYLGQDDVEGASGAIEKSFAAGATSFGRLAKAKILLHQGKADEVSKYLSKISPKDPEYEESLIISSFVEEDYKKIEANISKVESKDFDDTKVDLQFLADSIRENKDKDKLRPFIDTSRAYVLLRQDFSRSAIVYLESAIKTSPEYFDPKMYLAVALENIGENQRAQEVAQEALSLKSTSPQAYQVLGKVAFKAKNLGEFSTNYETAIAYAPQDLAQEIRREYADRLIAKKLHSTAEKIFEDLLKNSDQKDIESELLYRLVFVKMLVNKSSNYAKAIELSESYVTSDKFRSIKTNDLEKAQLLAYLCGAKIKTGDRIKGEEYCNRALEEYEYTPEAYYFRGVSKYDLDERREARDSLEKAIDLDTGGEIGALADKLLRDL